MPLRRARGGRAPRREGEESVTPASRWVPEAISRKLAGGEPAALVEWGLKRMPPGLPFLDEVIPPAWASAKRLSPRAGGEGLRPPPIARHHGFSREPRVLVGQSTVTAASQELRP